MPTPVTTTDPPTVLDATAPADATRCAACPHPEVDHDPISLRFCRATATATLDRGCICRAA